MTDERLDPRVRSLLDEALEEQGLDMELSRRMLDEAQRLEGQALEDRLRDILGED